MTRQAIGAPIRQCIFAFVMASSYYPERSELGFVLRPWESVTQMKPSDSTLSPSVKLNGIQDPEHSVSLYGQREFAIKALVRS